MKKLLAVLLAAIACVACMALVGCGGVEGTYKFESMTMTYGDQTQTIEVGQNMGGQVITEDMMIIELKKGGECVTKSSLGSEGTMTATGTWKKDGKNIILTIDGDTQTARIDGKKLIIDMTVEGMGQKIVLSK